MGEAKRRKERHNNGILIPPDKKTIMHLLSGPVDEELHDAFRERLKKVNARRATTGHRPLTLHAFVVYVLAKNALAIFDQEIAAAEAAENLVKTPEQAAAEYRGQRTRTPALIGVRA